MATNGSGKHSYSRIQQTEQLNTSHAAHNSDHERCTCCMPQYSWFIEWRFHIGIDFWYSLFEDALHITIHVLYAIFVHFTWIWYGCILGMNVIVVICIVVARCKQVTNCACNRYQTLAFMLFIPLSLIFNFVMMTLFPFTLWTLFNAHASHKREITKNAKITDLYAGCMDDCMCTPKRFGAFLCYLCYPSNDVFYSTYYPFDIETIRRTFHATYWHQNTDGFLLKISAINYYLLSLVKTLKYRQWIANIADLYVNVKDTENNELLQFEYIRNQCVQIQCNLKLLKLVFVSSMVYRVLHFAVLSVVGIWNMEYIGTARLDVEGEWFIILLLTANFVFKVIFIVVASRDYKVNWMLLHIAPYTQLSQKRVSMDDRRRISDNAQMLMDLFEQAFYVRDLLREHAAFESNVSSVVLQYAEVVVDLPTDGDLAKLYTIFVTAYSQLHFAEAEV